MLLLKLAPAKPTCVYDTFWKFAAERQNVFYRRMEGTAPPWSDDPVLKVYKFTNAYRACDRVSQYLIRNVIYRGDNAPEETLFRILLFKTFNRIETWESLVSNFGEIRYSDYSFTRYDDVLSGIMANGRSIYSGAYIMASGRQAFGSPRKHQNHLRLIESMMSGGLPKLIARSRSMSAVFDALMEYPTIGYFLAYQYSIDVNYSELTDFSEMEFVVPGPGAVDGISKCFETTGGLSGADVIRMVTERQLIEFERLGLAFQNLFGRALQLIDVQNLFCEISKYSRVVHPEIGGHSGRTRIKQKFYANSAPIDFWFPPKWNLNEALSKRMRVFQPTTRQ